MVARPLVGKEEMLSPLFKLQSLCNDHADNLKATAACTEIKILSVFQKGLRLAASACDGANAWSKEVATAAPPNPIVSLLDVLAADSHISQTVKEWELVGAFRAREQTADNTFMLGSSDLLCLRSALAKWP